MNRKVLSKIKIFGTIIPLVNFVSCLNKETTSVFFSNPKRIVIASAIPTTWPQYSSIQKIIKDYNDNQKNITNFMPVKFMSKEDTKAKNYQDLSSKINKLLATKSSNIPNLLVANFNQAYELSSYDRLIDLTSELVKPKLFNYKFVEGRTKLKHKNYQNGLWAVPFTVTTNSSLVFNKPVMKKIITLMKQNHQIIVEEDQENNPFIYSIMQNQNDIEKYDDFIKTDFRKPSTLWKDNSFSPSNKLSNYAINDNTFASFKKMYEFAQKVTETLKLEQPPYIFGSYFIKDFLSILDTKTGVSDNNFPLFKTKSNGKGYDFPFLNNQNNEAKVKEAFKEIYKLIKSKSVSKPEDNNLVGLRNGQFAFSTMPSVSSRYSYKSKAFRQYTNDGFAFEDFIYLPQLSKFNDSNIKGSYSLAESMLMGIKTSPQHDKAVKNFIDYIYTKKMKGNNIKEGPKVSDYLANTSGYVIPLKENTTSEAIANYKQIYHDYLNNENGKEDDDSNYNAAIYRSIVNTFESIKKGSYRNFEGDQYTSKLISIIKNIFDEIILQPNEWSAEKFISEIKKSESEFNIYNDS